MKIQTCTRQRYSILLVLLLFHVFARPIYAANMPEVKIFQARGDYHYPPYEFMKDGKPAGFNVELLQAVSDVMGFDIEIQLQSGNETLNELEQGEIDILFGMLYSQERYRHVDFSIPYLTVTHGIFVRQGSSIESLNDLKDKEIIVQHEDIIHNYLTTNISTKSIIFAESPIEALRLLASGKYDGALLPKHSGLYLINQFKLTDIKIAGSPFYPKNLRFAVTEENAALSAQLNEGLAILKATGTFRQIHEKWFGGDGSKTLCTSITKCLAGFLIPALVLLFGVFLWSWSLRTQIRRKSLELESESSERKRVEDMLAEEQNLLRILIDYWPDYIYVKNSESRFLMANKSALQAMGFSNQSEVFGKTDFDVHSLELARQYYMDERSVIKTGRPLLNKEEIIINAKTGKKEWILTTKIPFRDKHGEITGLVGIGRNITHRRYAEEALRVSEKKFSVAFHSSPVAMTMVSLQDGKFLDVNDSFVKMFDYSRQEIIGQTIFTLSLITDANQRDKLVKTVKKQKSIRNFEFTFHQKSGKSGVGMLSAEVIDFDHESCVLVTTNDMTERKQAEEALAVERTLLTQKVEERTIELSQANAELARAARLKDEFLANMSHELRTPLNAILGMSEALQEEVYGSLENKQRKAVHVIEESGRHLLELINDILDLSKIGAGKMDLDIGPVIVEQVCQVSLRFIVQSAQKKRIKVLSMFDGNQGTTIRADGRRLKQILVNLLSNAVKFTPEGGQIELKIERDQEHSRVNIAVRDTGIGIAGKDMKRLFHPFTQLDAKLSRKYGGTGLGLSLVYSMVEMHGGSISVESEVDKGSCFSISLPWRCVEKDMAISSDDTPSSFESTSFPQKIYALSPKQSFQPLILLAEDNRATLKTVSDYLYAQGYQLTFAKTGREVIERLHEQQIHLIVMDIQMPEMNGLEAIRQIRASEDSQHLPIIAVTALAMPGDREQCLKTGADDYMSKPVSLQNLSKTIEFLLLEHWMNDYSEACTPS